MTNTTHATIDLAALAAEAHVTRRVLARRLGVSRQAVDWYLSAAELTREEVARVLRALASITDYRAQTIRDALEEHEQWQGS